MTVATSVQGFSNRRKAYMSWKEPPSSTMGSVRGAGFSTMRQS